MRNAAGVLRAMALVLGAGGLVAGASVSTTTVQLAAPHERAGLPRSSDVLVEDATLSCPGQTRLGAEGLRDVPGTVAAALAAPAPGLVDGLAPAGQGSMVLRTIPTGTILASGSGRGQLHSAVLPATVTRDAVTAVGTGALAPGLVAGQTWARADDDDRGLAVTPCTLPSADLWLVGGGGGPSRTERLVLTNPGANAVSASVEVLGSKRTAEGEAHTVSIPPHSRAVLSVDALAPDEPGPAVHVVARGGVVAGALADSWIEGATGRGAEDVAPSAAPGTDLVVPGVELPGEAELRLVNPGATEAVAQVRLLTSGGGRQVEALRALRVPARSTLDVPLASLPEGMNGLRIVSDRPVTAGVRVDRRAATGGDRMGDFGWAPATHPIHALGGMVVPKPADTRLERRLALVTGGSPATVSVTTSAGATPVTRTVTLEPDTALTVELGDSDLVWVVPTEGEVHAAVTISGADGKGPLYSVAPVLEAPVSAQSVPVRQVRR